MKKLILAALIVTLVMPAISQAQDIREAARKAEADRSAAKEEAAQTEAQIIADRTKLLAEVERLEQEQTQLEQSISDLQKQQETGNKTRAEMDDQWSQRELGFREISGNVRVAARDLESMLKASPLDAGQEWRLAQVSPLLDTGYFPDIDDITGMTHVFLDEITRSGQVSMQQGQFVGRDGLDTTGRIFQVGKFTTVYQSEGEIGFLTWSPAGRQLFALAELPPRNITRGLEKYFAGEAANMPLDFSGGAALRQLTHSASLVDQIRQGGPIVWPILLIGLAALLLIIYKVIFMNRLHGNTDRLMGEVNTLAAKGDWDGCEKVANTGTGKSGAVGRVIKAGIDAREEERETLESVLQEAILHELPTVQRGLAMLAVLGAVAPLLGLLGTVTGMIDTFRVITLFGTSDPKLMSGGISEALVTTELGLAVAIPIMLCHTYLSRRSDRLIGEMEEQAVRLTNIIRKRKLAQQ
ncbi:MAG: biopolymer transport protein ExbB [Candidatus Krumholzibacteriia bacterium]|jgi:biopolymer transport protein ExbB